MEVQVILNETVVERVTPGLRAKVEFEALPNLVLEGSVESVSQIPNRANPRGEDVRYFFAGLKLDRTAPGLKPGMTAMVTFDLPHRRGVIAVPHRAVTTDVDKEVCFVAVGDQLQRRVVQLGTLTTDLVEIKEGLSEGEEIVLEPPGSETRPGALAGFEDRPWPKVNLSKAPLAPRAVRAARGPGATAAGPGATAAVNGEKAADRAAGRVAASASPARKPSSKMSEFPPRTPNPSDGGMDFVQTLFYNPPRWPRRFQAAMTSARVSDAASG